VISTIVSQNLYVGGNRPAACAGGGTCYDAVFNYMATQIDESSGLLKGHQAPGNQYYRSEAGTLLSHLGGTTMDPPLLVGDRWNGPSKWGNIPAWGQRLQQGVDEHHINGTAPTTVYYYVGSAIYFSINQQKYWYALGVDMTMAR
jgi:hypothetical protein